MKIYEENLEILKKSFTTSAASIIITNVNGLIEFVNPQFEKRTGYSAVEVIGKNPKILKSGNTNAGKYKDLWETISSGNTWSGEFQNKRKNGELFWEYSTIYPIVNNDNELVHFLAVKEDITSIKRMDQMFEKEILKGKLKARVKFEFLDTLSREIRTPLNIIISFAELLRSNVKEGIKEDLSPYLIILKDLAKKLEETIEFILNISEANSKEHFPESNFMATDFLNRLVESIKLPTQTIMGLSLALESKFNSIIDEDLRSIFKIMLSSCRRVIATIEIVEHYSKHNKNEIAFLIQAKNKLELSNEEQSPKAQSHDSNSKIYTLPKTNRFTETPETPIVGNDEKSFPEISISDESANVGGNQISEADYEAAFCENKAELNEQDNDVNYFSNNVNEDVSDRFVEIKKINDVDIVSIKFRYVNYLATRYFNNYFDKYLTSLENKIIFDFSLCRRVDPCFLGLLIKSMKEKRSKLSDVTLVLNFKKTSSPFAVSHLEQFFSVTNSLEVALAHYEHPQFQEANAS